MNQQNVKKGGISVLILSILFSLSDFAWPQTTLEKLDTQIRQRINQQSPPAPAPGLSPAKTAPAATKPAASADEESKEPGYLGLLADDRQDRGRGVRVLDVAADGPAAKGGLKKQDLITTIAGIRTRQMSDMSDVLNLYAVGETIEFEAIRDNKPLKLKVTLGRRPPQEPAKGTSPSAETKKTSILELYKLKSASSGEKKTDPSKDAGEPELLPPNNGDPETPPTVEEFQDLIQQMQKRIEELESQVADLEKALAESKAENKKENEE